MTFDDARHIAELQRRALKRCRALKLRRGETLRLGRCATALHDDRDSREVCGCDDRRDVCDREPLVRRVEDAARAWSRRVARNAHDVVQRDVVLAQTLRVNEHLELPVALSPDRDVSDAGDRH